MGLHSHIQLRICHSWLVRIDHFPPLFELWKLFSIKLLDHSLPTFVEFHSMNVWLNILAETQEDPYAGSRSSSSEWPAPSAWCDSSPPSREVGLWMAISVFSPRKELLSAWGLLHCTTAREDSGAHYRAPVIHSFLSGTAVLCCKTEKVFLLSFQIVYCRKVKSGLN